MEVTDPTAEHHSLQMAWPTMERDMELARQTLVLHSYHWEQRSSLGEEGQGDADKIMTLVSNIFVREWMMEAGCSF